jgi:hypothetical protein
LSATTADRNRINNRWGNPDIRITPQIGGPNSVIEYHVQAPGDLYVNAPKVRRVQSSAEFLRRRSKPCFRERGGCLKGGLLVLCSARLSTKQACELCTDYAQKGKPV